MSELIINFGDITLSSDDPRRKYVIVDVCEKSWFFVCEILDEDRGLGIAGTADRSNVAKIIGSMGLNAIIVGIERNLGGESQNIRDLLQVASLKPPRILR